MTVLCVDPDPDERAATVAALETAGLSVRAVDSVSAARDALDGDGDDVVDCLVTEYDHPDGTGLDLVAHARETAPDTACVLYTDRDPAAIDTVALGDAVAEYLQKGEDGHDRLVELVGFSVATRSQTAYPLPDDEDARLAALDRFAADPDELDAALARLTEIAAATLDVDAAAVGLIDAHQERFLGCYGIDIDRMDREDTVCTYAILEEGVTVVEDLHEDPRFADNEAIEASGLRFYAGAPVVALDGSKIGTFCLFDFAPRSLSAEDRALLELFAAEAGDQLALRGRLQEQETPATDGPGRDDGDLTESEQ
ncbi:small GAF containing sensor [Halobacteriales archaeon SW_7_71_33]|nr:MAG: small GAF containing sensor [Halobacteriales archaeon SW_7_71_33]